MKGQTLIFEQVILFSISVAIFLILFSVFNLYQNVFLNIGSSNQLDQSKEWISSNILKVSQKESTTVTIPVSRYIGDSVYEISLNQTGLTLRNLLKGEEKYSTLFGLNSSFVLSGDVSSIKGKITIKKEENRIIIV